MFFVKVVLLRFKEFHGLQGGRKHYLKPWSLSCTENNQPQQKRRQWPPHSSILKCSTFHSTMSHCGSTFQIQCRLLSYWSGMLPDFPVVNCLAQVWSSTTELQNGPARWSSEKYIVRWSWPQSASPSMSSWSMVQWTFWQVGWIRVKNRKLLKFRPNNRDF